MIALDDGSPKNPRTETATVLVVDDEPDVLESLVTLLREFGSSIEALGAPDGDEALRILGERTVDVVVCDYKLPGRNGLQVLEELRQIRPGIERILVTAYPDKDLAIDAINRGRIRGFLAKPFAPEALLESVQEALDEKRRRAEETRTYSRELDRLRRQVHASRPSGPG